MSITVTVNLSDALSGFAGTGVLKQANVFAYAVYFQNGTANWTTLADGSGSTPASSTAITITTPYNSGKIYFIIQSGAGNDLTSLITQEVRHQLDQRAGLGLPLRQRRADGQRQRQRRRQPHRRQRFWPADVDIERPVDQRQPRLRAERHRHVQRHRRRQHEPRPADRGRQPVQRRSPGPRSAHDVLANRGARPEQHGLRGLRLDQLCDIPAGRCRQRQALGLVQRRARCQQRLAQRRLLRLPAQL